MPSPGTALEIAQREFAQRELAQIGRAPRTGRIVPSEISGLPMLLRPPAPAKASPWPWIIGVFLVCSGLVFGFLALGGLQGENGRLGQMVQTIFPGSGLNLRVRNEDDRLRLSWNQRNHAVASATDATLQIFDGQTTREIALDGRQVADGSVLYRPLTNDVTFRLVVRGDQGSATGSVRLLDGLSSRQATLDVSSPIQTAAVRPPLEAPAAAPVTDPTAPAVLRDGAAPALLRDGAAAAAVPAAADPDAAYVPPVQKPVTPPVAKSSAPSRYETPATIGTYQPAEQAPAPNSDTTGGTTINGWDPVPVTRSKTKPRNAASYTAPRPLVQVMPNVRSIPVGTLPVRTRVAVKVNVDSSGHVTAAHVTGPAVNAKVASAAISAARQWMFDPAKDNGRVISSEHTIVFVLPVR